MAWNVALSKPINLMLEFTCAAPSVELPAWALAFFLVMNCTLNYVTTTFLQPLICLNESTLTDFSGVGEASSCMGAGPNNLPKLMSDAWVSGGKLTSALKKTTVRIKFGVFIIILNLERQ